MNFFIFHVINRICRNKRPGRLILRSNKTNSKTHQNPSVLCTPPFENHSPKPVGFVYSPFEKSPIKTHRFCVLPPLKNHLSKAIDFVYSPLWKSLTKTRRFCVLPPLKNHYFWWTFISGWVFISVNTVYDFSFSISCDVSSFRRCSVVTWILIQVMKFDWLKLFWPIGAALFR